MRYILLVAAAALVAASPAPAEPFDPRSFLVFNGDDKEKSSDEKEAGKDGDGDGGGSRPSETKIFGPNHQPHWTHHRRFTTVNVYIAGEVGEVEFEQWIDYKVKRGRHNHDEVRFREELEFGLPYRFQAAIYLVTDHVRDGKDSTLDWHGIFAEIRWAPFKWDVVFGNPTLYFEYKIRNGEPDAIEPKLLFGGDICPRLHWGLNLIYESTVLGTHHHSEQEDEWGINAGLAYGLVDNVLSVALEVNYAYVIEREREPTTVTRFEEFFVGPTLQWRPLNRMHLLITVLRNLANDLEGDRAKVRVIFGFEF